MNQRTRGWILIALAVVAVGGFLWFRHQQGVAADQAAVEAKAMAAELSTKFDATSGRPTPGAVEAGLFGPELVTVAWPDVPGVQQYTYTAHDGLGDAATTRKARVELVYVGRDRAPGWCFDVTYGNAGKADVEQRECPDGPGPVGGEE